MSKKVDLSNCRSLGKTLKLMRVISDTNQGDFCRKIQAHPATISNVENGSSPVTLNMLRDYSEFFDVKISSIYAAYEILDDLEEDNEEEVFRIIKKLLNKELVVNV